MKKIYCTKCGKECTPEGIAAGYGVIPETLETISFMAFDMAIIRKLHISAA